MIVNQSSSYIIVTTHTVEDYHKKETNTKDILPPILPPIGVSATTAQTSPKVFAASTNVAVFCSLWNMLAPTSSSLEKAQTTYWGSI